jgi:hypothetical protein
VPPPVQGDTRNESVPDANRRLAAGRACGQTTRSDAAAAGRIDSFVTRPRRRAGRLYAVARLLFLIYCLRPDYNLLALSSRRRNSRQAAAAATRLAVVSTLALMAGRRRRHAMLCCARWRDRRSAPTSKLEHGRRSTAKRRRQQQQQLSVASSPPLTALAQLRFHSSAGWPPPPPLGSPLQALPCRAFVCLPCLMCANTTQAAS